MKRTIKYISLCVGMTAVILTGCGSDEESSVTTSEVTTVTILGTTEDTASESSAATIPDPEDIDVPSYGDLRYSDAVNSAFDSTNGELEGQDEFMRLRLDWGTTRHILYDDLDWIEDPDTRALAESYEGEGYFIYQEIGGTYGDVEYEFTYGFGGTYMDGETYKTVSVLKMNETLFDYYVRTGYRWSSGEGEQYDDGTVIGYRYSNEESGYNTSIEFNRETGFLITSEEEPRPEYWPLDPREVNFDDDGLEAYAQACFDRGYILSDDSYGAEMYYEIGGGEYPCSEGFQYYEGYAWVECFAMPEELFWEISGPDWNYVGGEYYTEDDGDGVNVYFEDEQGEVIIICAYNRTLGIASVVRF